MEFIEGKTLDAKIKEGPFKLEEAVRIASEIASALEAAHEKNIVHRDVKSANVMLTTKISAKVLDFGLAKTAQSTMLTRMGSTLGTVTYMSPEQTRGEDVDLRSDLWSLGVVLYEMITGKHPFAGDYEQAVTYSILNEMPEPPTAIRTGVPMQLEWIVNKCLAKKADERYQSAKELLVDLRNVDLAEGSKMHSPMSPLAESAASAPAASVAASVSTRKTVDTKWLVIGLVTGLVLASLYFLSRSTESASDGEPIYSHINLPHGVTLEPGKSGPLQLERKALALSPDGQVLVIVGSYGETTALYRRHMSEDHFDRLPGTDDAYGIIFSPEGNRVAFYANDRLKTISVDGGAPRDIAPVSLPYEMVWLRDDRILFVNNDAVSLDIVPITGGDPISLDVVYRDDPQTRVSGLIRPEGLLPNGNVIMRGSPQGTYELDVNASTAIRIDDSNAFRLLSSTGHVLFADGLGLAVVESEDLANILTNRSATIVDSLYNRRITHFDADANGTVVFVRGPNMTRYKFVWLSESSGLETLDFEAQRYEQFMISPDGKAVLATVVGFSGLDIWIRDLARGSASRLSSGGINNYPIWSVDGTEVFYHHRFADRDFLLRQAAASLTVADTLAEGNLFPSWVSPDGKFLGVTLLESDNRDLAYIDLENPEDMEMIAALPDATEGLSRISRSGKYVAYTSNRTGISEVYVQTFPPSGREWPVSIGGGEEPIWALDDRLS